MPIKIVWSLRTSLWPSPSPANNSLYRCTRIIYVRSSSSGRTPPPNHRHGDGVFPLLPCKSLYFGGFKKIIEFREQLRELPACFHGLRQLHEILHAFGAKTRKRSLRNAHPSDARFSGSFCTNRSSGLSPEYSFTAASIYPFHGMRLAIVAYRSEGLIRAEQSVRAAKTPG